MSEAPRRLCIRDARGRPSRTLPFVAVAWAVTTLKFLVAGLSLGPLGTAPAMGAGEYGAAMATILGIWVAREWRAKELERDRE